MQFQNPLLPDITKLLYNASKFDNANQAKAAMVEAEEFAKAAGWENYSFSIYSFEV